VHQATSLSLKRNLPQTSAAHAAPTPGRSLPRLVTDRKFEVVVLTNLPYVLRATDPTEVVEALRHTAPIWVGRYDGPLFQKPLRNPNPIAQIRRTVQQLISSRIEVVKGLDRRDRACNRLCKNHCT